MLEGKKSAMAAIKISWQITKGNFWKLLLLVLLNMALQLVALPTIIGAIPVTGFANTARAAAFRRIWEEENYGSTSSPQVLRVGAENADDTSILRKTTASEDREVAEIYL